MSVFEQNEFAATVEQEELEKALSAGYGTDAAEYVNGRALQQEDLEGTLVNVLDVMKEDCKVFHSLHKQPVKSTVHQFDRRIGVGDDEFVFNGEGEAATESDQEIERKFYQTKYISTLRKVSHQMTMVNALEDPINSEKIAGLTVVTRAAERAIFHGDSSVQPKAFDGFIKQIKDSANNTSLKAKNRATIVDLRGFQIGEENNEGIITNEDLFGQVASDIYSKGGNLKKAYYPPILADQFKKLYEDKLRYSTGDTRITLNNGLPDILTPIGSLIKIKDEAGADKMFKVKGEVAATGNSNLRPNSPKTVTVAAAASSTSLFKDGDAGDYIYTVHALNSKGISGGTSPDAAVAVAAGNGVTITITPNTDGPAATGYIICRSAKDGKKAMEMVRIPAKQEETTVYLDDNKDLPGTASIVLLSDMTSDLKPNVSFGSLMPASSFELPRGDDLSHRFVVALYGMLEVRAPEHCAIIDNIGYAGGLY